MADYKRRIKYQRIAEIVIPAAGNKVAMPTGHCDQQYMYVTGALATIQGDELGFQNSEFTKFEIDGQEVFPQGFEAKLIAALMGTDVKPNDKFHEFVDGVGRPIPYNANNTPVNIEYEDGSFPAVVYPYTVNVWLRLENIDELEMATAERMAAYIAKTFYAQDKGSAASGSK